MTDKEFKRLNRSQLIDIIYKLQIKLEELTTENEKLQGELNDKRLRLEKAGNIAEAALQMNSVMESAQNAANQYLDEIRLMYEKAKKECGFLTDDSDGLDSSVSLNVDEELNDLTPTEPTEISEKEIIAETKSEILPTSTHKSKHANNNYDSAIEEILKKFKHSK